MKKKIALALLASGLMMGAVSAEAQVTAGVGSGGMNWNGPYIGAKTGYNHASADGFESKGSWTNGVEGGYNWNLGGPVVGVDAFWDWNLEATHAQNVTGFPVKYGSHVYGVDGKLGVDMGQFMPYAKLGLAHTSLTGDGSGGDTGLHGGLGVEYMVMPNLGVTGEWTHSRASIGGVGVSDKVRNDNFTAGVNYHF